MNLDDYVKKLRLPLDFAPPKQLRYENLLAEPLLRAHLAEDLAGVNASIDIIRRTRGGSWPDGPISEEFNLLDLAWHEREFRDRDSFAYVLRDTSGTYLGCFYLYPLGMRTALSEATLQYDVDASWWVTEEAFRRGDYSRVRAALSSWLAAHFPFKRVLYSNVLPG